MEVVVGTYEEVLLGYRVTKVGEKLQFEQSFTDNSHTGCLKTVTVSSKGILASGGTDETIKLFNLKKRLELGSLVHHSGTVVGLEFYKGNHLFSVSEDGTLAIWKYYTWECLKTLRGHKSAVNGLSVHPSGKLALTVSRDKTLKTWNLIEGKCAYTTNLKAVAELVAWSKEGTYYAILFQTKIEIYKVETGTIYSTVTVERRPNTLVFLSDDILVYGCEGGSVVFHDIADNKQIHHIDTQTNRIRGVQIVKDEEMQNLLFTASSDGQIKLYQISQTQDSVTSTLLADVDSKFRLTCIAVHSPKQSFCKEQSKESCDITEEIESKGDDAGDGHSDDANSKKKKGRQKRLQEKTESETVVVKKKPKIAIDNDNLDSLKKKSVKERKNEKQKRAEEKQIEKGFADPEKEAKKKAKKRKKFLQRQKNKKLKV